VKEKNGKSSNGSPTTINLTFQDNALLPMLFGENDAHLEKLERKFNIQASSRGNLLALTGEKLSVESARNVMEVLYADLKKGSHVNSAQVDAAIRMEQNHEDSHKSLFGTGDIVIKTMKKTVQPYSSMQAKYIQALGNSDLVFALGPAGTGKTYIAVAMAVSMFLSQRVEKIILSRPAVEAGEKLGFLPGDLKEKIDPYLRPLYDALFDMIPAEKLMRHIENGEIEVAPLAFMRGRTFSNAFVILDESQNTTATQMKMFLTRMGENSRMVVTGDLSQTDLPKDVKSGLGDAVRKLELLEGIETVRFSDSDVVRHGLVAKIIQAYDEWDRKKKNNS
jgi:phosphate starvation-inducible protein PhoH and related proteins